jgi:hypothetical protein
VKDDDPRAFEPFERWVEEFTKRNEPFPMLGARQIFKAGYLAAIDDSVASSGILRPSEIPITVERINRFGEPVQRLRRGPARRKGTR